MNCKKLEDAKNFCDEIKNLTLLERENHLLESKNGSLKTRKTKADYTICEKMSVSESKTTVEYLFEQGKCGQICRKGKFFHICKQTYIMFFM